MTSKNTSLNLLVEIGAEELPLSALDLIYSDFKTSFSKLLERERINFSATEVEATPRRIAFFVFDLSAKQQDLKLEISGPSAEKAYDAAGKPTQALLGFIKSKEITEKDIEVRETPKGKFIFGHKELKGKPVAQVLPALIQEVFQAMPFKRGLRWDATGYKFPRPIRWIVALLGNSVLKFKIADVTSGKTSLGHRFLSPKGFNILKADWPSYSKLLDKQQVFLSLEKREALIRNELTGKYGQKNPDEELVHECAQLVEKPFFLEGNFPKEYLELPAEVLATSMKKHQRVFAVYQNGKLQNKFVAVMNGKRDGLKEIAANFEKVLDSRLKDARFFFQEDTKTPLKNLEPKLSELVYLGSLGSMRDKVLRLEEIAPIFCQAAGKKESSVALAEVALLSKCDLLTKLVYEFPELQGIVGGEYARHSGAEEEIARAIAAQYLPKNLSDAHQSVKKQMGELSALFGVLDRLDLLVGAFGTGIEPTGSQDPFALRRAGGILVKLIRAFEFHFSLNAVVESLQGLYGHKITKPDGKNRLFKFLQDRIAFELSVKPGMAEYEILQAVVKTRSDDVADIFLRYEKMLEVSQNHKKDFIASVKVVQRIANILKGSKDPVQDWKEEKLVEPQEKALANVLTVTRQHVKNAVGAGLLSKANQFYASAFERPVMDFFEKVMVNAEDAEIRKNRLGLLTEIRDLYTKNIADLSLLSRIE